MGRRLGRHAGDPGRVVRSKSDTPFGPAIAPRHVAIVDRTGTTTHAIVDAVAAKSAAQMYDKLTHKQVDPPGPSKSSPPGDWRPLS